MILLITWKRRFFSFSFRAGGNDHIKPVLLVQAGVFFNGRQVAISKKMLFI